MSYPLSPAHRATEDRRTTHALSEQEFQYFLRVVRVADCPDEDQRQLVVVDAILYFDRPGYAAPARDEQGKDLSYYLRIKAGNLFRDLERARRADKRGRGLTQSLDQHWQDSEGHSEDGRWADAERQTGPDPVLVALEHDTARTVRVVLAALANYPDKQALMRMHLCGDSFEEITVALGWGTPDPVTGKVNANRARKSLFDAQLLLARLLPALNKRRLGPGAKWAVGESEKRPTRFMSSAECLALSNPELVYAPRSRRLAA
jgi:hypothetical protein